MDRAKKVSVPGIVLIAIGIACVLYGVAVMMLGSGTWFFAFWYVLGVVALVAAWAVISGRWEALPAIARHVVEGVLVVLLAGFVATQVLILQDFGDEGEPDLDYIVVLGAGVNGTVPSLSLRERINAAYDYLTAHPDSIAVVSGGKGNGEDITEALCMYNELTKMGIDGSRVWMEDKATSTFENLQFSMALIEERTGSRPASVGIVSSEYHLFRAGLFADAQNVDSIGIPATTTWPHLRINYFIREIIAVWHYIVFGG